MNAAVFKVHGAVLGGLIHMPSTAKIVDSETDYDGNVTFTVIDPDLPDAPFPHAATPTVTILTNPDDFVWDWGIQ